MIIVITEQQYKGYVDFKDKSTWKNANTDPNSCPVGFVKMSQSEIKSYDKKLVKPWGNTTDGSGDYIVKNSSTICKRTLLRNDPNKKISIELIEKMKKQTFQQNMDMIREFASSAAGIGVAVSLDAIGIGEIINPVFWLLFLVYDVWLWVKKDIFNLFNIIIDLIGVITAGSQTKWGKNTLNKLGKWMRGGVELFVEGMAKESPELFKFFKNAVKFFSKIISKITGMFKSEVPKLIEKLPFLKNGLTAMEGAIGNVKGFLSQFESSLVGGAEHAAENELGHSVGHFGKHYAQHYAQHQIAHDAVGGLVGHGGHQVAKHTPKLIAQNKNKKTNQPIMAQNMNKNRKGKNIG